MGSIDEGQIVNKPPAIFILLEALLLSSLREIPDALPLLLAWFRLSAFLSFELGPERNDRLQGEDSCFIYNH